MIRVFGITGTNGKTTASWMLRNILEESGPCGLIGTIEHIVGDVRYTTDNTTPGRKAIAELFHEMTINGIYRCVMEVSSHGIEQGRISDVVFSTVGFTNLSRDHLDYHGTMEEYFQVKKRLFDRDSVNSVINIDDTYGAELYGELLCKYGKEKVRSLSLAFSNADFYGKISCYDISGTDLEIYEQGGLLGKIRIRLPGKHFALDALLAVSMARMDNLPFTDIKNGLEKLTGVRGRMDRTGDTEDTLGIIDYAHTPDSLEKLLQTVSELKRGKLLCVFGCGGERDKGKREVMGRIAGSYCDYCIITNDNPRGEPPENIAQAIEQGLHETGCEYSVILDRYQAIKRAVSLCDKWDIIVVAGKGHERYQISGNNKIPFDDKEVLKELLEKKYEKTYNETD